MWLPPFGLYDLVRMHGFINVHNILILMDDGATHNFLNYKLVKKLKLPQTPSEHTYMVPLRWANPGAVASTHIVKPTAHRGPLGER